MRLDNVTLMDGRKGTRIIKLVGNEVTHPDERAKMADELSVIEEMGEQNGTPTEALAVNVETFYDYNLDVQIIKNSSFEKNQVLDQAIRHEYANWRLSLLQYGYPVNVRELSAWVDESYDIDSERFEEQPQQQNPTEMTPGAPGAPGMPGNPVPAPAQAPGGLGGKQVQPMGELI